MNSDRDVNPNASADKVVSRSKRTVLKAAWVPPVILAISLPRSGYAQNVSEDGGDKGKGKGK